MKICSEKKLITYESADGKEPFTEWLKALDRSLRQRVLRRLERVSLGNFGDFKNLGCGLYELKFTEGLRVYYAEVDRILILLLAGGEKNTKRDQSRDIAKAREFLNEYMEIENGK
jgi:putative addiction module killer protein